MTTTSTALIPYDPAQGTPAALLPSFLSSPQDYSDYVTSASSALRENPESERQFRSLAIQRLDASTLDDRSLDMLLSVYEKLGATPLELFTICLQDGQNEAFALRLLESGKLDLDKDGETMIFAACSSVKIKVLEALLKLKPSLSFATDITGCTPLTALCKVIDKNEDGIVTGVSLLVAHGCDIDHQDIFKITALARAVANGHKKVVAKLLVHQASVLIKIGASEMSLLHVLYRFRTNTDEKTQEMAKMLIDAGVGVDDLDSNGNTALIMACEDPSCLSDALIPLLEAGANVNALSTKGDYPIHLAYMQKDLNKIRILVSHGVNIHQSDGVKYSPYHQACKAQDAATLSALMNVSTERALLEIQDFPSRIDLCHFNSLGGKEKPRWGSYEGSFGNVMAGRICDHLSSLPDELLIGIDKAEKEKLISAFKAASESEIDADATASCIQRKELVILPAGYKEHAITLTFANGYLAICNRGDGVTSAEETIIVYKIDPSTVTPDIIRHLIDLSKGEREPAFQYIYQTLPRLLSPVRIPLGFNQTLAPCVQDEVCTTLQQHFLCLQDTGTCAFASAKGALRVGAALLKIEVVDGKPTLTEENAEMAEEFSHIFSTYLRLSSLHAYDVLHATSKEAMDVELRDRAKEKVEDHIAKQVHFEAFIKLYSDMGYHLRDLFMKAVARGNLNLAKRLLEIGAVDIDEVGIPALNEACTYTRSCIVDFLLNTYPMLKDQMKGLEKHPIFYLGNGRSDNTESAEILKIFIRNKCLSQSNETALVNACFYGQQLFVVWLLEADPGLAQSTNELGQAPLDYLCQNEGGEDERAAILEAFAKCGITPSVRVEEDQQVIFSDDVLEDIEL